MARKKKSGGWNEIDDNEIKELAEEKNSEDGELAADLLEEEEDESSDEEEF